MENSFGFKIESPILNHQCFNISEEKEKQLNTFFFAKKYHYFYKDKLNNLGIVISIECMLQQKDKIKIVSCDNINEYVENSDSDFYLVFLSKQMDNNICNLLLEDLIDFFNKTKKYILLNNDLNKKSTETCKEEDFKIAYEIKEKIYYYISFLSILNFECIEIEQEKKEKKHIIPKDCFLEKPTFVGKNKIVGWRLGSSYDYDCGSLKNVVYSFYSIFIKRNEDYVNDYILNKSKKYTYPIFVDKIGFECFDNQKAYNYKKIKDKDIYLYVRMNAIFFINHAIEMLKDNNVDIEDFLILVRKSKK